jgi:hypothetical protein
MDESQVAGLTLRPTALLPSVFKGISPAEPAYSHLAGIPAGEMALLLGKGTPKSTANKIGGIYHAAGTTGDLPSTNKLLQDFTRGKGLEDMFQGVKAHKGDSASYSNPGYVYGQEPLPMGQATASAGALLDAALYGEPLAVQAKYGSGEGGWGSYLIDKWAGKALKKPAGAGKPVYRYVGRHLFK